MGVEGDMEVVGVLDVEDAERVSLERLRLRDIV